MCECNDRRLPPMLAFDIRLAELRARVGVLEKHFAAKAGDGPCDPEPLILPNPEEPPKLIECILAARADYLTCLIECDGDADCCHSCHHDYNETVYVCYVTHGLAAPTKGTP